MIPLARGPDACAHLAPLSRDDSRGSTPDGNSSALLTTSGASSVDGYPTGGRCGYVVTSSFQVVLLHKRALDLYAPWVALLPYATRHAHDRYNTPGSPRLFDPTELSGLLSAFCLPPDIHGLT
jgi:hypothetical protein